MSVLVKKWGNSPAVRLSQAVMRAANISLEQEVKISVVAGKIIIEAAAPSYEIDVLIAAITPENCHSVMGSGERGTEQVQW